MDCIYLTNMPTEVINEYGLSKTLLTRRETIYLKHIMKNLFVYGNEDSLNKQLEMLQFKSIFQYMGFVTDKLRAIYKLPRHYTVHDVDSIVKQNRRSFIRTLEIYKDLKPIIILDFDKTITNPKFHDLYRYLTDERHKIIINSANPNKEVIVNYLNKYGLVLPESINANKGKKKKITKLKDIVLRNLNKIIFYIDDEAEYLDYGCLLLAHCYQYTKDGRIKSHTIFEK